MIGKVRMAHGEVFQQSFMVEVAFAARAEVQRHRRAVPALEHCAQDRLYWREPRTSRHEQGGSGVIVPQVRDAERTRHLHLIADLELRGHVGAGASAWHVADMENELV